MISWLWLIPTFIAGYSLGIFVETLVKNEVAERKLKKADHILDLSVKVRRDALKVYDHMNQVLKQKKEEEQKTCK